MAKDFDQEIEERLAESVDDGLDDAADEEAEAIDAELEEGTSAEDTEDTEQPDEPGEVGEIDQPEAKTPESDEPLIAPKTWPEEWKNTFNSLPAEAQKVLSQMNKDMVNGFNRRMGQMASRERELSGLQKSIQPHMDRLQRAGMNPEVAIQRALAWDAHIAQNGPKGILEMAQAYGIDPQALTQGTGQQEYMTPTERSLQQKLDDMQRQLMGTQAQFQNQSREAQQRQRLLREENANRAIQGFMHAKDPSGKPLHPHFEHLAPMMTRLLQSQVAQNMDQAYEMAASLDPDVKAARERARQAAERKANERKVEQVRKASNAGITSKSTGRNSNKSFEDEVAAEYRKRTA